MKCNLGCDFRFSQGEVEEHEIASVSADGLTITTVKALTYTHTARVFTDGGVNFEMRGEVGLLSRNVKVNGKRNTQFDYEIDKCDRDFDSGK